MSGESINSTWGSRSYFPDWRPSGVLALLDVQLLTRPPEHAPTLAEAIRALCDGHGDAS